MKGWKKAVSSIVMSSLIIVALSACSSNEAPATSSATGKNGSVDTSGKQVSLRFSWWGNDPRHQATLKAIDAYTALHPNVKIEAEYMGFDGYSKKLLTQFAGNTAPDLFQFTYEWDNDMSEFLLDLSTSKGLDTSGVDPEVLNNFGKYKDRLIMMPSGAFAATVFTNEGFLEKYDIPLDTVWTWDKLIEEGKKVHAKDANAYLLSADIDVINKLILQPYVSQQMETTWIKDDFTLGFNKEQLTLGLTYLSELYKNNVIEPFGDSSAFVGKMEQNPKWIKGEVGMLIDYIQSYDKYKQAVPDGKLGVNAFPQSASALQSGNPVVAGTGFAVSKDSPNAEEAIKFINWMTNDKDAALILETQRGVPATEVARKALQEANKLDPNITKGLDLAAGQKTAAPNVISTNTELAQITKDAIQKLIYQKSTPEQAADEIIKDHIAKLEEMK